MRIALLLLLCAPLTAAAGGRAEADRLMMEMERLASKSAWKGVERTYTKLLSESKNLPAEAHLTAANAARQLGDATNASRRYLRAERVKPGSAGNSLAQYRTAYGRLAVRRVEATCVSLTAAVRPFDPTLAEAIRFAQDELSTTGAFDGLIPAGDYTVGPYAVTVLPGPKATKVQRRAGDSDCTAKE